MQETLKRFSLVMLSVFVLFVFVGGEWCSPTFAAPPKKAAKQAPKKAAKKTVKPTAAKETGNEIEEIKGLYAVQKFDEALVSIGELLAKNAKQVDALYYRGLIRYRQGKYTEALAAFDQAVAIDPGYKEIDYNRGLCYLALADAKKAEEALKTALGKEGENANILYSLGLVYARSNNFDKMIETLGKAVKLNPALPVDAYYYLGMAHFSKGQLGDAERVFSYVYQTARDTVYAQYAYQYLVAIEKYRAPAPATAKQFKLFNLSVIPSYGYDTNVTTSPAEILGPQLSNNTDDYKSSAFISFGYKPVWKGAQPLSLGYSYYQNDYHENKTSNTIGHMFNATHTAYPNPANVLTSKYGYSLYTTQQTGQSSYISNSLELRDMFKWIKKLSHSAAWTTVYGNVSSDVIPASADYNAYNYAFGYQQYFDDVYNVAYELKFSNTKGVHLAFMHHDLSATGTYKLPRLADSSLTLNLKYNNKNYSSNKNASGVNRVDNKLTWSVSLAKDFYEWNLSVKYTNTNNNANHNRGESQGVSYGSYVNNAWEISGSKSIL